MKPTLGAIAIVIHDGKVLLIRRRNEPSAGKWAFPGGGVELGETAMQAAGRELLEETGVIGTPLAYLTNIDVILRDDQGQVTRQYLLAAVTCAYVRGDPVAADDALDAGWFSFAQVKDLDTTDDIETVLDFATP